MNAVEIEEAVSRLAEVPFNPEEFPFAFLEAFGNKSTTIKRLKIGSSNQFELPGGVLQRVISGFTTRLHTLNDGHG